MGGASRACSRSTPHAPRAMPTPCATPGVQYNMTPGIRHADGPRAPGDAGTLGRVGLAVLGHACFSCCRLVVVLDRHYTLYFLAGCMMTFSGVFCITYQSSERDRLQKASPVLRR